MSQSKWTFRVEANGRRSVYHGLKRMAPSRCDGDWPVPPEQFEWGEVSMPCFQLAHMILMEVAGDELFAGALYRDFALDVLVKQESCKDFTLEDAYIMEWLKKAWTTRHPSEAAVIDLWLD